MAIFGLFKKNKKEASSKSANQTKTEPKAITEEPKASKTQAVEKTATEPLKKQDIPSNVKIEKTEKSNNSVPKNTTSAKTTTEQNTSSAQKKAAPSQKAAPKKVDAPTPEKKPVATQKKELQAKPQQEIKVTPQKEIKPVTEKEALTSYTGKFEINKSKDGKKFFFNLYASNKVGIATSQMYSSAQSALNGVKSVIANAEKAPIEDQSLKNYETLSYPKWEIYVDNGGKYRFRLNASNGNCVCHSQGYTTKNACKNGIDSIIRSSKNAEIEKTYTTKKDEE